MSELVVVVWVIGTMMSGSMLYYFQRVVFNQVQEGSSFSVIGLSQVCIQSNHDYFMTKLSSTGTQVFIELISVKTDMGRPVHYSNKYGRGITLLH